MDIRLLFQLAGVGILVAVLQKVLEQADREEYGWMVTVGGVILVLMVVIRLVTDLFDTVQTLFMF